MEKRIEWDADAIYAHLLLILGTNSENIQLFLNEQIEKNPGLYTLYFWRGLFSEYHRHDHNDALQWYLNALSKVNYFILRNKFEPYFISHIYYADPIDIIERVVAMCVKLEKPQKVPWILLWSKLKLLNKDYNIQAIRIYMDIKGCYFERAENRARTLRKCLKTSKN